MMNYVDKLEYFYAKKGLLTRQFQCQYASACKEAAKCELSQGAEAHVGSRYGENLRVVVVSLDTGGDSYSMEKRRSELEAIRPGEKLNPHMRGTTELLKAIYSIKAENDGRNPYELYAMINAAKCSRKDENSNRQAPRDLFQNCSGYVEPELACLAPQLIVTQGTNARLWPGSQGELSDAHWSILAKWVAGQSAERVVHDWLCSLAKEYLGTASVSDRDVPVLKSVHPSAWGQWGRFARTSFQPVVAMAKHLARSISG